MSDIIDMYDAESPDVVVGDGKGMSMEEYFNQMDDAQQAVLVRDGDDSIEVIEAEDDEEPEVVETEVEGQGELPQIDFNPTTMQEAENQMQRSEQGFEQMKADIVNRGVPVEELAQMQANFDAQGALTDQQYNRLAEVGYTREFVDSYIQGQQALSQAYVNQFVASVGGIQAYQSVVQTLQSASPEMVSVLESAIANRDLTQAKAIITLAGNIRKQTYGQPAQRTVTHRAVQAAPQPAANDGFTSKQEMVTAMSDKRYGRDATYTKEVQRKVALAPW